MYVCFIAMQWRQFFKKSYHNLVLLCSFLKLDVDGTVDTNRKDNTIYRNYTFVRRRADSSKWHSILQPHAAIWCHLRLRLEHS